MRELTFLLPFLIASLCTHQKEKIKQDFINNAKEVSQDIFIYLRWKAVRSVVTVQTHRDMFTAFVKISEESCFPPQVQRKSYGLGWGHTVRCGVGSTSCATVYTEPLALTEIGFFVCQSVFHRNPSCQDFLIYSHPNTHLCLDPAHFPS